MKPLPKLKKSCMGPQCKGCSASMCYSKGGSPKPFEHGGDVDDEDPVAEIAWEEHKLKAWNANKEENEKKLKERLAEKGPHPKKHKHFSEGGDVDEMKDEKMEDEKPMDKAVDLESELDEAIAGELEKAFESKNKKEILEVIRAIVLTCKE